MTDSGEVNLVAPLSLTEQVNAARSGELPLQDLIAQSIDRLEAVNPLVRAILPDPRLRERLSSEAADIMDRWPTPSLRPPLFGTMVAVKDIFNVGRRMPTRAGSAVPPESFSGREADVVARLREAGALVLGKAVTTEFAYFAPGATANPHNRAHTPGRLQQWLRRCCRRGHCTAGAGLSDGRLGHPSGFILRRGWIQAVVRPHSDGRDALLLTLSRHNRLLR